MHKNFTFILVAGFAFFVLDFVVKSFMTSLPANGYEVIPFFKFNFVANHSMAFSIPIHQGVIIFFSMIILLGLIQYFTLCCRDGLYGHVWALNFIIWGAFGNVYDRIIRGFVVDYIQIGVFPIFNLADIAVVLGFIGLLYFIEQEQRKVAFIPA